MRSPHQVFRRGAMGSIFALATTLTPTAYADLIGSTVTGHLAFPTENTVASNTVSAVVGSEVEFPDPTFYTYSGLFSANPVTIDLTGAYVLATIDQTNVQATGAFNGYVFDFTHLSTPITNAYLDPSSSFTPAQGHVSFSSDELTYSDPGVLVVAGDIIKIDVLFGTPPPPTPPPVAATPEPSSLLLFGTGFLGLLGVLRFQQH